MRNEKLMGRHKKTDSLERPSALDNKNLNSYYRIIEIFNYCKSYYCKILEKPI